MRTQIKQRPSKQGVSAAAKKETQSTPPRRSLSHAPPLSRTLRRAPQHVHPVVATAMVIITPIRRDIPNQHKSVVVDIVVIVSEQGHTRRPSCTRHPPPQCPDPSHAHTKIKQRPSKESERRQRLNSHRRGDLSLTPPLSQSLSHAAPGTAARTYCGRHGDGDHHPHPA